MSVDHRGPYIAVAEERLDRAEVVVSLQEVRGEAVAEGMGGDTFRELRLSVIVVDGGGTFRCFRMSSN